MSELIACHHKVTLDIAKRDVCTIEVVNRDTANILEVNVCENGKEVSLENATLITITYSNDTVEEMQISEDFKTASVRINANCLKRGINFAKVCIYSGDNGLITAEMLTINCKQTVGSDNPSVPDPDMPTLKEMIAELVKQSASSEQIAAAVSQYLKDNPITETDPTVPDWAKEKNKPTYTAAEVGALSGGTLDAAINDALAQAKASGEFDGKSAYAYAQDGGYAGTEAEFAAKLAAEKLPNPYPLTFTGAVSETYDGSSAKTIEIPSGGGGAFTASYTVEEEVTSYTLNIDTSKYSGYAIFIRNSTSKAPSITINREHKRISFTGNDANVSFFEINTLYSNNIFQGFSLFRKNNNTSAAYYNYSDSNNASGTTEANNGIIITAETIGAGSVIFVRCI